MLSSNRLRGDWVAKPGLDSDELDAFRVAEMVYAVIATGKARATPPGQTRRVYGPVTPLFTPLVRRATETRLLALVHEIVGSSQCFLQQRFPSSACTSCLHPSRPPILLPSKRFHGQMLSM